MATLQILIHFMIRHRKMRKFNEFSILILVVAVLASHANGMDNQDNEVIQFCENLASAFSDTTVENDTWLTSLLRFCKIIGHHLKAGNATEATTNG